MQAITKYQAKDGREFTDPDACLAYEALCDRIDALMAKLPPLPKDDGCAFANGDGCIQHDPHWFHIVRAGLLSVAAESIDHKWIAQSLADASIDPSWVGRLIDDAGPRPLARAWQRIMCTDANLREWGQPFYRYHPDEAKSDRRINP